ncbi:transposase [Sphingomonas sp. BK580]|uniref:transposase n=1 Tax=Sphingomonas sp. BK580 TaxID=2586972 RepID=UPI001607C9E3|nr:transposase [Sphingomonas sp. BK580]MBB3695239.1 transposase [Sphingomonas sp. BK580]
MLSAFADPTARHEYGLSTTVYNPFNRWSHRGFWLELLDAALDARVVTKSIATDSTYVKAQRAAFGAKGGCSPQATGRSRGGWTIEIPALTDGIGRHYALMLTPGNVSAMKAAPALLGRAGRVRYLLGDKGYDAARLRRLGRDFGAIPVIPGRRGAIANAPSATTSSATPVATSSRMPYAASRASAVSPPTTTDSLAIPSPV